MLSQWEDASVHGNPSEPNEIHVMGDMNLDALNDKWLSPTYHLAGLADLVQTACNLGNFSQLIKFPTRYQFKGVSNSNEVSCIDHAYTNRRFRCSQPVTFSFGDSDHNLIGYTRFSKEPPRPSKTVRKRSYKTFSECNFIADLSAVDWCEVYSSRDVDVAVEAFTAKYLSVLNLHAPWIVFQLRKNYSPWISEETLALMKQRDNAKNVAANLVQDGRDAADAWKIFKRLRNQVNNKRKQEEKITRKV